MKSEINDEEEIPEMMLVSGANYCFIVKRPPK